MYLFDLINQIWQQTRKYKLRTFLALFGIFWGTFSIIMLLALSSGFSSHQKKALKAVANNFILFYLWPTKNSFHGYPAGRTAKISVNDIMQFSKTVPHIKAISPLLSTDQNYLAVSENRLHTLPIQLTGISSGYSAIYGLPLQKGGRLINALDTKQDNFVAIISSNTQKILFPNQSAIGESVSINHIPFKIIGVVDDGKNKAGGVFQQGPYAYIPYTTYENMFGRQYPNRFSLSTEKLNDIPEVVKSIKNYFALYYGIDPNDKQGLGVIDSTKILGFVNWFFGLIQGFFLICGALTLAVGGLGVANILFLIINQRAKEIGVRIAIGAKTKHILLQVLLESSMIVFLGGMLGFGFSLLTIFILHIVHLPEWLGKPTITLFSALSTVILLSVVAILAGFFPARRAALMNPVDAINKRGS